MYLNDYDTALTIEPDGKSCERNGVTINFWTPNPIDFPAAEIHVIREILDTADSTKSYTWREK